MKIAPRMFCLPLLALCLACLSAVSALEEVTQDDDGPDSEQGLGKRLYDFGLGKRPYRYVNEYKRLPMYDFGLGKRAKMYSFGLGKRSEAEEEDGYDNYLDDGEMIPETEMYDDDSMQGAAEKRAQKMYSFGLGKRPLYGFGLGKRARPYDFGLGKRPDRLYSFGLGKRAQKMYSFGLGKRSVDGYSLDKREVSANELKAVLQASAEEGTDGHNSTAAAFVDSHEQMGHGGAPKVLEKRSMRYNFGLGKREDEEAVGPSFPRQYRKPSAYNFGLGKRRQMYSFGLGKRSFEP